MSGLTDLPRQSTILGHGANGVQSIDHLNCVNPLRRFLIPRPDRDLITWRVPNASQHLKNMKTLVTKCERIEAAFRAIRMELESLPKTESIEGLLRQNELDIAAAVKRARIARDVLKRERASLN